MTKERANAAFRIVLLLTCCAAQAAMAAPPGFRTDTCPVKLDGVRLGSDLTPSGSSLRNTIAYEPATRLFHMWLLANDDPAFPATSVLTEFTHATSGDGLHFTSDDNLHYEVGSADYADFGAVIDPPIDFVRATFDASSGTWKLIAWQENDDQNPSRWGQYNYNTSVNDLGGVAANTYALHQGPLQSPFAGNHVGAFGLVDGRLYLRVDSPAGSFGGSGGGIGQFDYTDAVPPATSAELGEADLYAGTPYCWFLDPACGASDPRLPAYVHNVGRVLRQDAGTIAAYYSFRDATTYARVDKQIWYVESSDDGATWTAPTGVFADGDAITIDGAPVAADGNFGTPETVVGPKVCRSYFSSKDADGNFVMLSATTGSACDALFADGFEGCGD